MSDSYLYKCILLFNGIRKPEKMEELLKALAWQIGNEVNYNALGKLIGLKKRNSRGMHSSFEAIICNLSFKFISLEPT